MQLYPLKFEPIFQERIWGGDKLKTELNKAIDKSNIGESWEISDVEGFPSIVSEGELKGKSLRELIQTYRSELLGNKNYERFEGKFPVLIKFIDAKKDLSIQLHPDDKLAKKRHDSFGKTEMWHVLQADKGSRLILGLNNEVNAETYLDHLESNTLPEILNEVPVSKGDTFFIEAGLIHAIGGGIMLAEIQQTSDVTYRVYDWDRVDSEGNSRELHNDLALEAIDFNGKNNVAVSYDHESDKINKMVYCPFFKTNFLRLTENLHRKTKTDSFHVYLCIDGQAIIESSNGSVRIHKGESVLIPACFKEYDINTENAELLEVYV